MHLRLVQCIVARDCDLQRVYQSVTYLHGISSSRLISHHADLIGLRANEVYFVIIADINKACIL